MQGVGSKFVDRRRRTLLNRPEMTRGMSYCPLSADRRTKTDKQSKNHSTENGFINGGSHSHIPESFELFAELAVGCRRKLALRARSAAVSEAGVRRRRLLDRGRGGDRWSYADHHLYHSCRLQAQEQAR